uniref:Retrovirus-related Pol polyprotein from transposon TNT 1-94 n=1 Tax=Cajanus cajan TaxID=3821 RepID=A0A151SH62_CAJCA|nr:hypothetical protein KK1_000254 [Cajanus cajan]
MDYSKNVFKTKQKGFCFVVIKNDHGIGFESSNFKTFCEKHGIFHNFEKTIFQTLLGRSSANNILYLCRSMQRSQRSQMLLIKQWLCQKGKRSSWTKLPNLIEIRSSSTIIHKIKFLVIRLKSSKQGLLLEVVPHIYAFVLDIEPKSIDETLGDNVEDADYVRDKIKRKNTSGGCDFIGNCLISWTSKKKNSIALSIVEAKYIFIIGHCSNLL